jgi:hypothetical protein
LPVHHRLIQALVGGRRPAREHPMALIDLKRGR